MTADLPPCGGDVRQDRGGQRRAQTFQPRAPIISAIAATLAIATPLPAIAADLPAGFVRLRDIDPTIRQDMRYAGSLNFMGRQAKGYDAAECILTEEAAKALVKAQAAAKAEGFTLLVFDCYRPIRAVDDFVAWVKQGGPPDPRWHPNDKRGDLIAKGYIGAKSSHSRGSTVDLALAPIDGAAAPDPQCGADKAGTIDFGGGFDCFDPKSATAFGALSPEAITNRKRLLALMQAAGFVNYKREWWHFTLKNEPFKQRFDFPIESKK